MHPLIQPVVDLLGIAFVTLALSMLVITVAAVVMRSIGWITIPKDE
jgi:hypothetical protein